MICRIRGVRSASRPTCTPARDSVHFGIRDVTDGTSNTAAYSERVKGIGTWNNEAFDPAMPTSTVSTIAWPPNDSAAAYALCLASRATPTTMVGGLQAAGSNWARGIPSCNTLYQHVMPPNTWSCAGHDEYQLRLGRDPHRRQPAPGRRQRAVLRRIGQGDQEHHQRHDLVGGGDEVRGRDHLVGPALSGSRRRATRARRCRGGREGFDRAPRTTPVGRRSAPGRDDRRGGATRSWR